MVLVDTSIWIESTRHKTGTVAAALDALLSRDEVATTDFVIAEVLQGTATEGEFSLYEDKLVALHYFPASRSTWAKAAHASFQLRRQGLATPLSDLVIATVALENGLLLYAKDEHFNRVTGLQLYSPD